MKNDRVFNVLFRIAAVLLVPALASLSSCARVPVQPAAEPAVPPPGFIRGTLAPDNALALSLSGAEVRFGTHTAKATASGAFALPQLPPGKYLAVAEKRFAAPPVRRLLGVATVYVGEAPLEVRIPMRDATDVDAYCLDCHPSKKNVTRRDQIIRDIHISGVVPVKAKKPTGKFDERGRVTCESCHSIHQPTGFGHFTLANYNDGTLCVQCH